MGRKASYTAEFKLKVILYADENGKKATAQQFNMNPNVYTHGAIKTIILSKKNFTWQ
jgi:transposase-like protein